MHEPALEAAAVPRTPDPDPAWPDPTSESHDPYNNCVPQNPRAGSCESIGFGTELFFPQGAFHKTTARRPTTMFATNFALGREPETRENGRRGHVCVSRNTCQTFRCCCCTHAAGEVMSLRGLTRFRARLPIPLHTARPALDRRHRPGTWAVPTVQRTVLAAS